MTFVDAFLILVIFGPVAYGAYYVLKNVTFKSTPDPYTYVYTSNDELECFEKVVDRTDPNFCYEKEVDKLQNEG